ncbi:MAG: hypothetical protein N4A59_00140 [Marinifilum sp.]|jgi:hypothetical protein|nr:hypothetical protein [Marinifilum sp.]
MTLRPIIPSILLLLTLNVSGINTLQSKMKAWIELEGEISNLSVCAKFENLGEQTVTIDYLLKTEKKGRSGNSSTSQRGKCISQINKILSLSEARMSLSTKDNLLVRLYVYHNKQLVAQDSVVLHGDNE